MLTALTAWWLFRLGRRVFGGRVGELAAAMFVVLGDPGIQKLGGMHVRAQCESFIALAVTGAILMTWRSDAKARHLIAAGVLLAAAAWLKVQRGHLCGADLCRSTAVGGARDVAPGPARDRVDRPDGRRDQRARPSVLCSLRGAYRPLARHDRDNVRYSAETYGGLGDVVRYGVTLPWERARVDGLWFFGLLGALLMLRAEWSSRRTWVITLWIGAALVSIVINGSRGLPQYFVQAGPALALAAAGGLSLAWRQRRSARVPAIAAAALIAVALWRVGVEPVPLYQPRLSGFRRQSRTFAMTCGT